MASAIVVGAGPAGATLSYLLARRGVTVTLLERQTDFGREFRGEVLMPSGLDALEQAGLGVTAHDLPRLAIPAVEIFRGVAPLAKISLASLPRTPTVVPQGTMLEMIAAEAAKFSGFTLERGATMRDLIMKDSRVAGVRADTISGPREFRANFVIAADGRTSAVRKHLGLEVERIQQGFDVVWTHVPGRFLDNQTGCFVFGSGHLFILYPSPEGHLQIGWIIKKGKYADFRKLGADGWLGAMTPYLPAVIVEFLTPRRDALAHPVLLDVVCDRLHDWTVPGALLIGDAAHPMSPVGAQGINIALRDAIVAANHLGRAFAAGASPENLDDAARAVQAERAPEVVTIQDMQQMGPRLQFGDTFYSRALTSRPFAWFAKTFLAGFISRRIDPMLNGVIKVRLDPS
jgi:2-polyprenyl-6-methoxyphenol hydroxylase-like FAD-dependent oxidoreductase